MYLTKAEQRVKSENASGRYALTKNVNFPIGCGVYSRYPTHKFDTTKRRHKSEIYLCMDDGKKIIQFH